jgi:DNA modification methylase
MLNSNMLNSNNFPSGNSEKRLYSRLLVEFLGVLDEKWVVPSSLQKKISAFLLSQRHGDLAGANERKKVLAALVDQKFGLTQEVLQRLYNAAALDGVYPSPAEKHVLLEIYLNADGKRRRSWLRKNQLPSGFEAEFDFVPDFERFAHLKAQLSAATVKRSDARKDVQEERRVSILRSLLGGWFFRIFPADRSVSYFDRFKATEAKSYVEYLRTHFPQVIHRDCAHISIRVPKDYWTAYTAAEITDWLCAHVRDAYRRLSNHTYLSVYIEKPDGRAADNFWALISDVSLFAERHIEEEHLKGYFKPKEIERATVGHIKSLVPADGRFDLLSYGFSYKDCFVLTDRPTFSEGATAETKAALLIFEKNKADETLIPCPVCRSCDVRGNSYPVFGVKSWECHNPLCPERSAFDRGYRYSVLGEIRKHSAMLEEAIIPDEIIKKWKLDVVHASAEEVAEMLVNFFTLPDDRIDFFNWSGLGLPWLSRRLQPKDSVPKRESNGASREFHRSAFFKRFLNPVSRLPGKPFKLLKQKNDWLDLYNGSCLDVLSALPAASADGAVTSPPYYNAREYSVWPNIYAYLYDMKIAAEGIFHVLKPGGFYIFNIFDYFDNENSFASSALGKKRLLLSAYMAKIFRYIGFDYVHNVVWFKGHVEGKRNYNRGNNVPFFQLPLNAWEHVMILRKPGAGDDPSFPDVMYTRPVLKMVKGENTHGHTAPFPESIPELLCSRLPAGAVIIDPFGGSLTTAKVCHAHLQRSQAIELHRDYCNLGLKKLDQERDLFS